MFDIDAVKCYYNDKEGATDRRLALIHLIKNNRQVLSGQGGYFCVLLLLIMAIKSSVVSISTNLLKRFPKVDFYVNTGYNSCGEG